MNVCGEPGQAVAREQPVQDRGGIQVMRDRAPARPGQASQVSGLLVVVGRGQDDQLGQGTGDLQDTCMATRSVLVDDDAAHVLAGGEGHAG